MIEDVISLFKQGKILARAMETPSIYRNSKTKDISYDFSVWADEYESAKQEGLWSLSTTMLISGESIPTYKSIGFLLNSDNTDVRHIAEMDSGSSGNEKNGDFRANSTEIKTLSELKDIIQSKHENIMNEVNINMRENAYIGLFANKVSNQLQVAQMLLAQKYYELQTNDILPMYVYDKENGQLENFNITLEEKANIIKSCLERKKLRSSNILYETQNGEFKSVDYLEEIEKDIKLRDSLLQSGINATEETTRTSIINEQVENIKQLAKDEKSKETERE